MMMPLRVFREIRVLKMAVEVGLVVGMTAADHADGLRDLLDAVGLVLLYHAAGLGVLVGVVDILGGVVVLDDLVLHNTHAGLLHGHFGQGDTLEVGGHCGGAEDLVDLLLGVGGVDLLRLTDPGEHLLERFRIVHDLVVHFCFHEMIHPFLLYFVLNRSFR